MSKPKLAPCNVCHDRPATDGGVCPACQQSLVKSGVQTIETLIKWASDRAWQFARKAKGRK